VWWYTSTTPICLNGMVLSQKKHRDNFSVFTPWSRVILEKLIVTHWIKKSSALYRT